MVANRESLGLDLTTLAGCRAYASEYECSSVFGDPPYPNNLNPEDFDWSLDPEFPVSTFLICDMTAENWAARFISEQESRAYDGYPGFYDDMIGVPIRKPIIIFQYEGRWFVSDGYHRIASRFFSNLSTLPAVVGRLKSPKKKTRKRSTPKSRTVGTFQIQTDGVTVWVNADDGSSVARFGKAGIDIHTTAYAQLSGSKECLYCTHTFTTIGDWRIFVVEMKRHYNITIPTSYMPDRFRD